MITRPTCCPPAVTSKKTRGRFAILSFMSIDVQDLSGFDSKNEENLTDAELLKVEEKRE